MKKDYRKYFFWILLLTLLIVIVFASRRFGGFVTSSDYFAIKNINRVASIILEEGNEKLVLKKGDSGWTVNEKELAGTKTIRYFLESLSRITIKSTVSESIFLNDLSNDPVPEIRVTVKEKPGFSKSYLVYPVSSNPYGNYFKKREKGIAYVVNIPGFSGNVGSLYITSEKLWLPHEIYSYQPSRIRMVCLEYPSDDGSSFMIRQDSTGCFELFSLPGELPVPEVNHERILRYLTYFSILRFERRVMESDSVDVEGILLSIPVQNLKVEDIDGEIITLRMFPIVDRYSDSEEEVDLNRIYGQINGEKELVVIRYMDIDPILKDLTYFTVDER
ncbi:MAG: hypothetical protein JSV24_04940 [Bacteroidales bacterium]|nr:MAG: hypothetical protein JSV24_04940 [Bacteroidales bacterium]